MKKLVKILCIGVAFTWSTELAAQQKYKLDPGHTLISFNAERFLVGEVTGKFKEYTGELMVSDKNELESATVVISTASLDSDHEVRDGHLKGGMWLDVENNPEIKFVSKKVWKDGDTWMISGDLTIKGATNEVQFPFNMQGPLKDPTGATAIGLKGDLTINRQDYNIKFSRLMDNGELFIGNEVRIAIRALAVLVE